MTIFPKFLRAEIRNTGFSSETTIPEISSETTIFGLVLGYVGLRRVRSEGPLGLRREFPAVETALPPRRCRCSPGRQTREFQNRRLTRDSWVPPRRCPGPVKKIRKTENPLPRGSRAPSFHSRFRNRRLTRDFRNRRLIRDSHIPSPIFRKQIPEKS